MSTSTTSRTFAAHLPALPGWKAVIVQVEDGVAKIYLPSIEFWGVPTPDVGGFGPDAQINRVLSSLSMLTGVGHSSSQLVPCRIEEDGSVLQLLEVSGFWGVSPPEETEDEVVQRVNARAQEILAKQREREAAASPIEDDADPDELE